MSYKNLITPEKTIIEALQKMDAISSKLLIMSENNIFIGLISIGDIQRAIIKNLPLNTQLHTIQRKIISVSNEKDSLEDIKSKMFELRTECMPVVNKENTLVNVFYWDDLFSKSKNIKKEKLSIPVVIMAGGMGTRLKPITNVIPKPLIPIGEKTMLEEIMSRFLAFGCNEFHLSVNYKADLIKFYMNSVREKNSSIDYYIEETPLGTAGSLTLMKDKLNSTFFVSNCDILIEDDYAEIYHYHKKNKNDLTIVVAMQSYDIPYGTIETSENGMLESVSEKPKLTFKINTGLYILEPSTLEYIPENNFFHITQLFETLKKDGKRVGVFPVSEKSWKDIGEWKEYLKNIIT